jgi:hypothetical protein
MFTHHASLHLQIIDMHCNTSVKPSQTYRHISHCIPETSGASSHISECYSFLKHSYSKYLVLFTHAMQTITRPSGTFAYSPFHFLSTPYMMACISESFYCATICTGTHSSIRPLQPLCLHLLKFSLYFRSIAKHTTSSPPISESIGTYSFLIYFFLFSFFIPISFCTSLTFFLILCVSCFGAPYVCSCLSYYSFRIFLNICTLMYM